MYRMTTSQTTRDSLPPYPPYSAWRRLLEELRSDVPARIDQSYLKLHKYNQSNVSMLQNALRFLMLIDQQDAPTPELRSLVKSEGEEYRTQLLELLKQSYGAVLPATNLSTITPDLLRERFRSLGARGDVARKCGSFFVALAREAGQVISPHLRLRRRQPGGQTTSQRPPKRSTSSRPQRPAPQPIAEPVTLNGAPDHSAISLILEKFPSFDPDWDQETVERWRDSLDLLLKTALRNGNAPQPTS